MVEEIITGLPSHKVVDVQSLMDFPNFCNLFITGFSKIAKPLTDLTKKGIKQNWTWACQEAFDGLKEHSPLVLF